MKINKYDGNGVKKEAPMSLDDFFKIKVMGFVKEVFWSVIFGVGVFVLLAILCFIAGHIFSVSEQYANAEMVVGQLKSPALMVLCVVIGWCIKLVVSTDKLQLWVLCKIKSSCMRTKKLTSKGDL